MEKYYAKSARADGSQETVKQHLEAVAALAEGSGKAFSQEVLAALCGQFHDFGKYSVAFQEVLKGKRTGVDHAICGAAYLSARNKPALRPAVEAIAAHHSALRSYADLEALFSDILSSQDAVTTYDDGKLAALVGREYLNAQLAFQRDFPSFKVPKINSLVPAEVLQSPAQGMLFTRMLFSCLVDADYTASAEESPEDGAALDAAACLQTLNAYCADLRSGSTADSTLNAFRTRLYDQCGKAGAQAGGLFTLTAPTGTGKTLALLHFALRHCIFTQKRRIIVVLPFLSLIEQSTAEYAKLIPNILEDHSQSNLPDDQREHAARWDQPFIITTSVRFFESLFADRPTDCRKLHNLADSVILFDEAQSLPLPLTRATLSAVNELCERYRCTMVFSTATQPAFGQLRDTRWEPRELLPEFREFYEKLHRCTVRWRLDKPTEFLALAKEMAGQANVCAIVNLRAHARQLYAELKGLCPEKEIFLLSTDLCPAHRTDLIAEIKERQKVGLSCRVVSTQCIEAGVDLDFAGLYRALAPMEAIVQAAGRCNRNGKNPDAVVTVFLPAGDRLYPDMHYENAAQEVRAMYAEGAVDIQSPDCIAAYYRRLFGTYRGDAKSRKLEGAIAARDYEKTAAEYRLIAQSGAQIIVPYAGKLSDYLEIRREALSYGLTKKLLHKAAPLTVTFYDTEKIEAICEPLPLIGRRGVKYWDGRYYILRTGMEDRYREKEGLFLDFEQNSQPLTC